MLFGLLLVVAAWCFAYVYSSPVPRVLHSHSRRIEHPDCPLSSEGESSLWLNGQIDTVIIISFIAAGSEGCAYKVIGPWITETGEKYEAVAKTNRRRSSSGKPGSRTLPANEIEALTAIHELLGVGADVDGWEWMIMKYREGKTVFQTTGWLKQFPRLYNTNPSEYEECREFIRNLYRTVARKQQWYADTYGWQSGDLNWANFLWNDDLTDVSIVDWGMAFKWAVGGDDVYNAFLKGLETKGNVLIDDSKSMPKIQGICYSAVRAYTGSTFRNPLIPVQRKITS